eukprot:2024976-Prymnesium_polylepis.1
MRNRIPTPTCIPTLRNSFKGHEVGTTPTVASASPNRTSTAETARRCVRPLCSCRAVSRCRRTRQTSPRSERPRWQPDCGPADIGRGCVRAVTVESGALATLSVVASAAEVSQRLEGVWHCDTRIGHWMSAGPSAVCTLLIGPMATPWAWP